MINLFFMLGHFSNILAWWAATPKCLPPQKINNQPKGHGGVR